MRLPDLNQFQCPSEPKHGLRKIVRQTRTFWLNRANLSHPDLPKEKVQWAWHQTFIYLSVAIAQIPPEQTGSPLKTWMSKIWASDQIDRHWQKSLDRYPFLKEISSKFGHPKKPDQPSSTSNPEPHRVGHKSRSNHSKYLRHPKTFKPTPSHPETYKISESSPSKQVVHKVIHNQRKIEHFLTPKLNSSEVEELSAIWSGLNARIFRDPALLGWVKQFFQLEELDKAICRGKSMNAADLPVATQLFTPRWIARFLAESTLKNAASKLNLTHPDPLNNLSRHEDQFRDTQKLKSTPPRNLGVRNLENVQDMSSSPKQTPDLFGCRENSAQEFADFEALNLKVCDPACGAGHLLIEALDVWVSIIQSHISEKIQLIDLASKWLNHCCFGLDIEEDVVVVAKWGLVRKFEELFPEVEAEALKELNPPIYCIQAPGEEIMHEWSESAQAAQIGALLRPPAAAVLNGDNLKNMPPWVEVLNSRFDVLITNPPYMQNRSLPAELKKLAKERVPKGKTDLFALFLDQGLHLLKPEGQIGFLTMQSWMFLKSFSELRQRLIHEVQIQELLHIGPGAFEDLGAYNALTVAFTGAQRNLAEHSAPSTTSASTHPSDDALFRDLTRSPEPEEKWKDLMDPSHQYIVAPANFLKFPDQRWLYRLPKPAQTHFIHSRQLKDFAHPRQGLATTDNQQFVRRWFEIPKSEIGFGFTSSNHAHRSGFEWFPYHKGGKFRRWYGNNEFVVKYENDGQTLIDLARKKYPRISDPEFVIKNRSYYFREGIVWSLFGFERFSVRYKDPGFIFDVSGASAFPERKNLLWTLAYLSSNVALYYLQALAPTVNFQVGDLACIPCIPPTSEKIPFIENSVQECIQLCRQDWNERQTSWEFDPMRHWTEQFDSHELYSAWQQRAKELRTIARTRNHNSPRIHQAPPTACACVS